MDTIRGKVINIVDGDTFDMTVTHVGKNNEVKYNDQERIRIADTNAPEINTKSGITAKNILTSKLLNKEVRISVKSRDRYGRIVGDIEIL